MNLIERVKNILTIPPKEWQVINGENDDSTKITISYLLPLVAIGTIAAFIGFGLVGMNFGWGIKLKSTEFGIKMALGFAVRSIVSVYILAFIIDALAANFGSEKNFNKSFQVAAYSTTAGLVASVFLILPSLAVIAALAGLYGLYLLYVGLPILKKTPEDKKINYFVVVLVVAIVINLLLTYLQNQLFYPKVTSLRDFGL